MQAKRNLTQNLCFKMSEVFKHTKKEAEYFESMVSFIQAKTSKEKDMHFTRMIALRKNLKVRTLEESQYEYYSHWYNPVIRELLTSTFFTGTPDALAKMIVPQITPAQARRSVALLLKLGLIVKKVRDTNRVQLLFLQLQK